MLQMFPVNCKQNWSDSAAFWSSMRYPCQFGNASPPKIPSLLHMISKNCSRSVESCSVQYEQNRRLQRQCSGGKFLRQSQG